jgi:plasmid maintenance system antidote protein VapI
MKYAFDIVGISPVLSFFNYQRETANRDPGAEYFGAYRCTLDAMLESVEPLPPKRGWDLDQVVDTVIQFWLNHAEQVQLWKSRLEDAGSENLLVARIGDMNSLRREFESLFYE